MVAQLEPCRACGADVSIAATTCLHCGHPTRRESGHRRDDLIGRWLYLPFYVFFGLLFLSLLRVCSGKPPLWPFT